VKDNSVGYFFAVAVILIAAMLIIPRFRNAALGVCKKRVPKGQKGTAALSIPINTSVAATQGVS